MNPMIIPAVISGIGGLIDIFGKGKGKPMESSPQNTEAAKFQQFLAQYLKSKMGQGGPQVNPMQDLAMSLGMGRYGGGQQWQPPMIPGQQQQQRQQVTNPMPSMPWMQMPGPNTGWPGMPGGGGGGGGMPGGGMGIPGLPQVGPGAGQMLPMPGPQPYAI